MFEDKDFLNLLSRCIQEDKEAWNIFVDRYGKLIYNYIITILKRYSVFLKNNNIDDIFDNIFVALLDNNCKKLKNFRGRNECSFRAYLRTMSFNMAIDFLRHQRKFTDLEQLHLIHFALSQYETIDINRFKDIISIIINDLPERHKYLFKLIYEEEMAYSEISILMNINSNAVHQLKFRMLNNFKRIAKEKNLYNELELYARTIVA